MGFKSRELASHPISLMLQASSTFKVNCVAVAHSIG
jgi:hypothetical protein